MTAKVRHNYLRRLPPEHYRGQAYVHWSLTMENRRTGWLDSAVFQRYREILTHAAFRFGFCVPIFCCMCDHIHMLWVGILNNCDQRTAFEDVADYIARNPERKGIVPPDGFAIYPFTGCLVPGYPELRVFEVGYWDRFWRIYSNLVKNGLHVGLPDGPEN